ncbi:hypothetical protein [Acidaminococcus sp. DS4831]|uniref:hypothetical protein n=1 Tax=Acidaminococcus sp. DS4831 TaxID=3141399 RepID=UPI0032E47206
MRGQDYGSGRMPPGRGKKGEIKMGMEEMDDDLFYDSYQLVSDLPDRDLLEQLAEESAELSQAALKLIRAHGMSQNPTPISEDKALASLKEEVNDVLIILVILGLADQSSVHDWRKLVRWAVRIQEAEEKKEAENGHAKR